jgi:hypothetical protein
MQDGFNASTKDTSETRGLIRSSEAHAEDRGSESLDNYGKRVDRRDRMRLLRQALLRKVPTPEY